MTVYEYGTQNPKTLMLLHPSAVMWDYFEYVIPALKERYHLIIPALPGYDKKCPGTDFTSVEQVASELADWLIARGIRELDGLYGCAMGGSIVLRMTADGKVRIRHALMDGGITPYQLPWIATRFIAVRDFLMIAMGKLGGVKLLEKVFKADEMSKEDIAYAAGVLKFMSCRTIWRTFESCNNYRMPKEPSLHGARLRYWYGDKEAKERKWDLDYIRKNFPEAEFVMQADMGHAGMALNPDRFCEGITAYLEGE